MSYVLISPARNEEKYIEHTLRSVASQTVPPMKWVIVSDGSTDRTDEIVRQYTKIHPFIHLLRREPDGGRNFASKVHAIRAGVEALGGVPYDFIGNLDADVSFPPDYFERVLSHFHRDPKLGLGGGLLYDLHMGQWTPLKYSLGWSVCGPIQMFRRLCYEQIGGYLPLRRGGIDMMAEVMTRMHGWGVRTFADIPAYHHRRVGTEKGNPLVANFHKGIMECANGYHPIFQAMRFFSCIRTRPFFLASFARTTGYLWALCQRIPLEPPANVAQHLRKEQMSRLYSRLRFLGFGRDAEPVKEPGPKDN